MRDDLDPQPIVYVGADGERWSRIHTELWTLPKTLPHLYTFSPRPAYCQGQRAYPRKAPTVTVPKSLWDEVRA